MGYSTPMDIHVARLLPYAPKPKFGPKSLHMPMFSPLVRQPHASHDTYLLRWWVPMPSSGPISPNLLLTYPNPKGSPSSFGLSPKPRLLGRKQDMPLGIATYTHQ